MNREKLPNESLHRRDVEILTTVRKEVKVKDTSSSNLCMKIAKCKIITQRGSLSFLQRAII